MFRQSHTNARVGPVLRLRHLPARTTMTPTDVTMWAALITAVAVIGVRARRRADRRSLPGAGDDKPPGYENPTPRDSLSDSPAAASPRPSTGHA